MPEKGSFMPTRSACNYDIMPPRPPHLCKERLEVLLMLHDGGLQLLHGDLHRLRIPSGGLIRAQLHHGKGALAYG